jgi:ABC-2 type transport system permease protein
MSAFLQLVRLRLMDLFRTGSSAVVFAVVPVLLLLANGGVFPDGHPFEKRRVAVVGADEAQLAALRTALAPFPEVAIEPRATEAAARSELATHMLDALLVLPGGRNDGAPTLLTTQRGQLFTRGLAAALPGNLPTPSLSVIAVSRWGYVHHLVPGLMAFTAIIAGLYGMGYAMVRYRQNQFLKKLALTPLSRVSFVGAQLTARTVLTMSQILLLVGTGVVAFGLPLSLTTLGLVIGVSLLGVVTFLGLGFALACLFRSEVVLLDSVTAALTPLVLLSGAFFPLDTLPRPLALLAEALPSTLLVRALRVVMLHEGGVAVLGALWPIALSLTAWLAASFGLAVLRFRWHDAG